MYSVKEAFFTLQGEGAQTGRASVFCRFAGCNLWSGREVDRDSAICRFCDTDFIGTDGQNGGKFPTADALADHLNDLWPEVTDDRVRPYVVFTGGEPALQLDAELVEAMHQRGFEVAIETNGTQPLADGIDWVCVSPKGATEIKVRSGNELKLVFPQLEPEAAPENFIDLDFDHFFLQPLDNIDREIHQQAVVRYCMRHPRWRVSLQTHKLLDID